jgi:hypothetical protein
MRSEVGDDAGVARWVGVLLNYVRLDIPRDRLPNLAALARRLDPARLRNVVAPGRIGMAKSQSVVYLTTAAARLFEDLRADAVVGGASAAPPAETASSTTTTTGPDGSTTTTSKSTTSTTAPAEESTTTSTSSELPGFFDEPQNPNG